MKSILDIGAGHLPDALDGDAQSLRRLFEARVTGWGKPFAYEEFITIGLFSDLEQEIESDVAFKLVGPAVNIALEQNRADGLVCALALLTSLVEATHTTEVPGPLKAAFVALAAKGTALSSEAQDQLSELSRYYRNTLK